MNAASKRDQPRWELRDGYPEEREREREREPIVFRTFESVCTVISERAFPRRVG